MSDGDDDFMCEEDEDYGLVSFSSETARAPSRRAVFRHALRLGFLKLLYIAFKNSSGDSSKILTINEKISEISNHALHEHI